MLLNQNNVLKGAKMGPAVCLLLQAKYDWRSFNLHTPTVYKSMVFIYLFIYLPDQMCSKLFITSIQYNVDC